MAEVAFARTFLSSLDSRPTKLSPDHVEDPKTFPARPPYILPRMPVSMSRPSTALPGQERSVTVLLKSLRNPPLDIKLAAQPLSTSILAIKTQVAEQTRIPVDKMKLLHNKRPLVDSKILKDLLEGNAASATKIEFSVMVLGGAAAVMPAENAALAPAVASGKDALTTEAFWSDLDGFLLQRLKDEETARELGMLFKSSWQSSQGASLPGQGQSVAGALVISIFLPFAASYHQSPQAHRSNVSNGEKKSLCRLSSFVSHSAVTHALAGDYRHRSAGIIVLGAFLGEVPNLLPLLQHRKVDLV